MLAFSHLLQIEIHLPRNNSTLRISAYVLLAIECLRPWKWHVFLTKSHHRQRGSQTAQTQAYSTVCGTISKWIHHSVQFTDYRALNKKVLSALAASSVMFSITFIPPYQEQRVMLCVTGNGGNFHELSSIQLVKNKRESIRTLFCRSLQMSVFLTVNVQDENNTKY